jgi:hypothetical protein
MLSKVSVEDDDGNFCILPNGEEVSLRETFPASGLYEMQSKSPLWLVNWYGEEGLVKISRDRQYALRINRFGGGGYGEGHVLKWGIEFYGRGKLLKSHHVRDLVDYPSLMPFTSSDWHYLWIDDVVYKAEIIADNTFELVTSTHESYRFDVTTGEIIEQHRRWKRTARIASAIFVVAVSAGVHVFRRRRKVMQHQHDQSANTNTSETFPIRLSFRLRTLLIAITAAAMLLAIYSYAAHVGIFLTSLIIALLLTFAAVKIPMRLPRPLGWTWKRRLYSVALWGTVVVAWLVFYVLTLAPVMRLMHSLQCPKDCQRAVVIVLYKPLEVLEPTIPRMALERFESYYRAWWSGWHFD